MPPAHAEKMGYIRRMTQSLDATGRLCPLPVLKARTRLMALQTGDVLELLTDDPAAIVDVPHFCHEAGHSLLSQEDTGIKVKWRIRKA